MFVEPTFWALLAASVLVHWLLPPRFRAAWIALASFSWLVTRDAAGAVGAAAGALIFFHVAPYGAGDGPRARRVVVWLVLAAVAYLAAFKYLPPLLRTLAPSSALAGLVLPIGISYYTFKLIHYAVESARGNVKDRSLATFLSYILLVPIFTAGPIERFDHFVAHREERPAVQTFVEGGTRIVHGFVKKFLIADWIVQRELNDGRTPAELFADFADVSRGEARSFLVLSFVYAYFDFAGYSDLAIGTSRLFGLRILENFDAPLLARNIGTFWKKWHMTLAGWCQSYVYMPTIGMFRNPYIAVFATFAVMGVWHSGTLNFLAWGLYHATGVCIGLSWNRWRMKRGIRPATTGPRSWWGILPTMLFVSGSYAFSTTDALGIGAALQLGARAIGFRGTP